MSANTEPAPRPEPRPAAEIKAEINRDSATAVAAQANGLVSLAVRLLAKSAPAPRARG